MSRHFPDDVYSRAQAGGPLEVPRQPRSPLREVQTYQPSGARDKSTSSSEKRSSSSKRNSLFSKRPKSAMSTSSSHTGPSEGPRRSLTTVDAPVVPSESDTSRSRFLFGRSRKSKHNGSKNRPSSPLDTDDERGPRSEVRHRREYSEGRGMRISAPFGFQHMANIKKEREEPRDLFADFRALRRGHRAAIIGPSRELEVREHEVDLKPQKRPAPLRPKRSDELLVEQQLLSPQLFGMQPLRQIRSAETFSTGMPPSSPPPNPPFQAPPKRPSHRPPPLNSALFQPANAYTLPQTSNHSLNDEWDRLLPLYENRTSSNAIDRSNIPVRSVSLPDAVPDQLRSPMFNPPLEQVPEEPEGTLSNRHSKDMSRYPSIRHARSSPMLSRDNSKASVLKRTRLPVESPVTERPMSQGSDTLGDPTRLSDYTPRFRDGNMERNVEASQPDSANKDRGTSWEDDIDYCYEHAAEADCDFDWNNVSRYEESDSSDDLYRDDGPLSYMVKENTLNKSHSMGSTVSSNEGDQYRLPNRVYKVPSKDTVPELEYRSSHSTSTNSISILTPLDKFSFPSSDNLRPNSQSQSMSGKDGAPAQLFLDFKIDSSLPQMYDDIIARAESSPPAIPPRSEERNEKAAFNDTVKNGMAFPLLPTPPESASQSPVISRSTDEQPKHDLHINTIVAQLRRPLDSPISPEQEHYESLDCPPPPPPKSPHHFFRRTEDEVPQLISRGRANTLNAAKGKLFDAQSQLQEWSHSSLPRNNSETSVLTAIPISKPPTPPTDSPVAGMIFLTTTPPELSQGSAYFLPPLAMSRSTPAEQSDRTQMHRKVSSDGAAKLGTPPMSPAIPRSASSASGPAKSAYSLFPQPPKESPRMPNLRSPRSLHFPAAMRSPPLTGTFPPSPFSPQYERFESQVGPPTPPKGFRARERRLATA